MDDFKPLQPPSNGLPSKGVDNKHVEESRNKSVRSPRRAFSKPSPSTMILWFLVIVSLAVSAGTAVYFVDKYNKSQKEVKRLSDPTTAAQDEATKLISKIGTLTDLPKGEQPTVATVTDTAKLADQPFFDSAVNGDRVLIYTEAKKAFLYRPSTNKVINIAPVNYGSGEAPVDGTTTDNKATP